MLYFLFLSWLLTGASPGGLAGHPGNGNGAIVTPPPVSEPSDPSNKPKPTVQLPGVASDSADPVRCCGPDPPPRPGDSN
jgi:hypothetical protein